METKIEIVPEHVKTGFLVQWFCIGDWMNYGDYIYPSKEAAEFKIGEAMKFEKAKRKEFRAEPATATIPAFPSRDYIEARWLDGYQGTRRGEANRYGAPREGEDPKDFYNYFLWEEGAEAYRAGKKLFE